MQSKPTSVGQANLESLHQLDDDVTFQARVPWQRAAAHRALFRPCCCPAPRRLRAKASAARAARVTARCQICLLLLVAPGKRHARKPLSLAPPTQPPPLPPPSIFMARRHTCAVGAITPASRADSRSAQANCASSDAPSPGLTSGHSSRRLPSRSRPPPPPRLPPAPSTFAALAQRGGATRKAPLTPPPSM